MSYIEKIRPRLRSISIIVKPVLRILFISLRIGVFIGRRRMYVTYLLYLSSSVEPVYLFFTVDNGTLLLLVFFALRCWIYLFHSADTRFCTTRNNEYKLRPINFNWIDTLIKFRRFFKDEYKYKKWKGKTTSWGFLLIGADNLFESDLFAFKIQRRRKICLTNVNLFKVLFFHL